MRLSSLGRRLAAINKEESLILQAQAAVVTSTKVSTITTVSPIALVALDDLAPEGKTNTTEDICPALQKGLDIPGVNLKRHRIAGDMSKLRFADGKRFDIYTAMRKQNRDSNPTH